MSQRRYRGYMLDRDRDEARALVQKLLVLEARAGTKPEADGARARITAVMARHDLVERPAAVVTNPNHARNQRSRQVRNGLKCKRCGAPAAARARTRRYCSVRCRVAAWRKKQEPMASARVTSTRSNPR